jgi:glycine cleavage system transcriptional repressor
MPKPSYYLLTAFGPDRPGMVEQLTDVIFKLRGNIEDASMTRLGGEFAMMLVVGLKPAAGRWLIEHVPALQTRLRLSLNAKEVDSRAAHGQQAQPTHLISIYGLDRPGIVHQTARAVARLHLNITNLQTKVLAKGKKPLYILLLELQIPSRARAAALERRLAALRRSLRLEITLSPIDSVAL